MVQLSPRKFPPRIQSYLPGDIELTCIVALPVLSRSQPDGGKCCIVLENVQTRSLVAKLPQCLSLAVTIRKLHAAS